MKRIVLFIVLTQLCLSLFSQEKTADPNTRKVNFGIKGGFNSSMYFVDELKIMDITINDIQNNYKVGYSGSIFFRFNLKKSFIQPELSYTISKSGIQFDKKGSQHPDIEPDYATINSTIHTIELPILYGYNFVKSGPYGMSYFFGPKIKYVWNKKNKIEFTNFDQTGIKEKLYPINVGLVIGLGVNISNIFFDFRYDVGLNNISKEITYNSVSEDGEVVTSPIIFKRSNNLLSFSFGFIF